MSLSIAVPLIVALALLALLIVVAVLVLRDPEASKRRVEGLFRRAPEAPEAAGPGPLLPPLLVLTPRLVHGTVARPASAPQAPQPPSTPSARPTFVNAATARSMCAGRVRGRELHPDARLALRHHREEEALHVDALVEQRPREALGERRVVGAKRENMIGTIGWTPGRDLEARPRSSARGRPSCSPRAGRAARCSAVSSSSARRVAPDHGRGERVREEVGPAALAQQADRPPCGPRCSRRARRRAPCRRWW